MHETQKRLLAVVACVAAASPAIAAQRTFVASYGLDSNNCRIDAPCRSFAAAIALADANGEVVVLDSAGYGRVTIDKSVTITVPPGIYGGMTVASGANGVDIATPGVIVVLRGMSINGQGGTHGVNFQSGAKLVLENCTISNMAGDGLHASAPGAEVYAADSVFRNNANGIAATGAMTLSLERVTASHNASTGITVDQGVSLSVARAQVEMNTSGIQVAGTLASVTTTAVLADTVVTGNLGDGVAVDAGGNGAAVAFASRLRSTRNLSNGFACRVAAPGSAKCSVRDSTLSGNNTGMRSSGAGATLVASRNSVARNDGAGLVQENSGAFRSRGNNAVHDNAPGFDTIGTITAIGAL
jgi:hypothetical protein